jgi:uncharacterized protein
VKWYRKAADQGDVGAQVKLGHMYLKGEGVLPDLAQAANWYRKAADQGNPFAQYELGIMYSEGYGVPRDYVESYIWFSLASAQSNEKENTMLDSIESKLTKEQITEAQERASAWKPTKLEQ